MFFFVTSHVEGELRNEGRSRPGMSVCSFGRPQELSGAEMLLTKRDLRGAIAFLSSSRLVYIHLRVGMKPVAACPCENHYFPVLPLMRTVDERGRSARVEGHI